MDQRKGSRVHSTVQKVASSRLGARLFSRVQHHIDRAVLALTGDRTSASTVLGGLPLIVLISRGAKSGLARSTPLIPIRHESEPGKIALVASNWGQGTRPGWYYNLKANPKADCTIRGNVAAYDVHEAHGDEYERYWQCAVDTYSGYRLYEQRLDGRHVPIMVLTPAAD